jgi:D-3-phosphoglycerate dehydrogenase
MILSKCILGSLGKVRFKRAKMTKDNKPLLLKSRLSVQSKTVLDELEKSFEVIEVNSESRLDYRVLSRVEYLWIHFDFHLNEMFLRELPNCKLVMTTTTGLTHFSDEAINKLGPKLIHLNHFRKELQRVTSTAELALSCLFHSQLNLDAVFSEVRSGFWSRETNLRQRQISGLRIGIVGLGRLGSIFAQTLSALGALVYFCEMDNEKVIGGVAKGYRHISSLKELCELSDIVTLHANVIDSKKPILTSEILSNITTPFVLINTSRSVLVDEKSIVSAIRSGVISSYYTDVLGTEDTNEPLKNSIIWNEAQTNSKINISPHIGGATLQAMDFCEELLLKELLVHLANR